MPVYPAPPFPGIEWELKFDGYSALTDRDRELLELWEMRLMHDHGKYSKAAKICNGGG